MNRFEIGEYEEHSGVMVAPVCGPDVVAVCGRLGVHPPYRAAGEAELLSFEDVMEAKRLAITASGITKFALQVGEADREATHIIASKSGVLVLSSNRADTDLIKKLKQDLQIMDGGLDSVLCLIYKVRIG